MVGMNRQQIVDAAERDGHQRHLGANGQVGRAGEKRPAVRRSVVRPPSGKTNSGIPERRALTPTPRLESVACGLAVSMGIWPERSRYHPINAMGHKLLLGENAKLEGQRRRRSPAYPCRRCGWRRKRRPGILRRFSAPRTVSFDPENQTQRSAQIWRDAVLRAAAFIHERNQQRQRTASDRNQRQERSLDQVGAPAIEPGQRIGPAAHCESPLRGEQQRPRLTHQEYRS